jgi:2-oxo-3-hexenedioate decarboxylase
MLNKTPQTLDEIAQTLDQAAASATSVEQVSISRKISLTEAYEIQILSMQQRFNRGEKLVGYKMGFTSRAKMEQMGVDDLIWGHLTDAMSIEIDESIDLANYVHPRAEPEIAFLLKKPLSGTVTIEEALDAIEFIAPAIEIIDSRYKNFKFSLEDVVADNCSSSGFVVGKWQSKDSNIDGLLMNLNVNDETVHSGSSNDILDHPINSLIEAARCISAAGKRLEAGQIILAGAATAAVALEASQTISVDVAGLGGCHFNTKG